MVLSPAAVLLMVYGIKQLAVAHTVAVPVIALAAGAVFGVVFVRRQYARQRSGLSAGPDDRYRGPGFRDRPAVRDAASGRQTTDQTAEQAAGPAADQAREQAEGPAPGPVTAAH